MKRDDETQTAYTIRLLKEEGHKEALITVLAIVKKMAEDADGGGYEEACHDISDAIEQLIP